MTTWLWIGWKTIRCCKFTDTGLLTTLLLANKVCTLQNIAPIAEQKLESGFTLYRKCAGVSLHTYVTSNAQDRRKLERLCRYITRSGVSEKSW
ncbi:MAG: hypothetical protein ACI81A_002860 [Paraglaciecola sp.]|jgi:hypothetical protein